MSMLMTRAMSWVVLHFIVLYLQNNFFAQLNWIIMHFLPNEINIFNFA